MLATISNKITSNKLFDLLQQNEIDNWQPVDSNVQAKIGPALARSLPINAWHWQHFGYYRYQWPNIWTVVKQRSLWSPNPISKKTNIVETWPTADKLSATAEVKSKSKTYIRILSKRCFYVVSNKTSRAAARFWLWKRFGYFKLEAEKET